MKTSAHNLASLVIAVPVGCLVQHYTGDNTAGLCAAAGCASGIWFSPDLDLGENRKARIKNWPWVMFWWPYAKAFKHRSFWSHAPIVGTAIRMVYFWGIIGAALWLLSFGDVFFRLPWALIAWGCIGLALADTAHWLMDNT